MALTGRVLDQAGIAWAEAVLRAVAQPDLELALEDDYELPTRGRMPVLELPGRIPAEGDLCDVDALGPIRVLVDVDRLDVRLPFGAGEESIGCHISLPLGSGPC